MLDFTKYGLNIPAAAKGEHYTTCPKCSQDRKKKLAKCLSVNINKECWICHHCGWAGPEKTGTPLHWQKPAFRKPKPLVDCGLPPQALEWFETRGITAGTLVGSGVRFVERIYFPQIEDFTTAIAFPFMRNGETVNVKYRSGKKLFRLEAGCERIPYGLDDLEDVVFWVEGEMDKLSLHEAGIHSVLSVPDGAPQPDSKNYESKFDFLANCGDMLDGKTHIVAVDSDAPGQRLEKELARRLGHENCKLVEWPKDCKDANEVLVKHGVETLIECCNQAKPYPVSGIFTMEDQAATVRELCTKGPEMGKSTGYKSLDSIYRMRLGEFTVVTGVPNTGKSPFVDNLAIKTNCLHGWKWGIFSAEHEPCADHMRLYIQRMGRRSTEPGSPHKISDVEIDQSIQYMRNNFYWISPGEEQDTTLDTILNLAQVLVRRHGINGLILDPWNEIECNRPKEMTEHEFIGHSLRKIRKFAKLNNVHILIVAHPTKIRKDQDGKYEIVKPYDIAGSSNWFNKPYSILSLWRDAGAMNSQTLQVYNMKSKFKEIGKIGRTELAYNGTFDTFHDLDRALDEIPPSYGVTA